jgi:hypothetical protein
MKPMKPTLSDTPKDRVMAKADLPQLRYRDYAVLPSASRSDLLIRVGAFLGHMPSKAPAPGFLPR